MGAELGIVAGKNNWATTRATEHIMQLEFPRDIVEALATAVFRENSPLSTGALDPDFVEYILNGVSQQNPDMIGMREKDSTEIAGRNMPPHVDAWHHDERPTFCHHELRTEPPEITGE